MHDQLENSLRIKVTGKCNRNCFFCHQEGSMNRIDEIVFTDQLKKVIEVLNNEFSISSIAFTGGEPLLNEGLLDLATSISMKTAVKRFSLTTNGSIPKSESFWKSFRDCGLYKVNISIPDVLDYVSADGSSCQRMFQNQITMIENLYSFGIDTNINVVVYNDKKHLLNVLNALFNSQVTDEKLNIALLPNLTNKNTFDNSQIVIRDILDELQCKKTKLSHRKGTSNTVCDYLSADGHHIQVKTTKPNGTPKWLKSICDECDIKENCQEGFYGLRLENRDGQLFLRLCLYKTDKNVVMSIDDFLSSDVYSELKAMWT